MQVAVLFDRFSSMVVWKCCMRDASTCTCTVLDAHTDSWVIYFMLACCMRVCVCVCVIPNAHCVPEVFT